MGTDLHGDAHANMALSSSVPTPPVVSYLATSSGPGTMLHDTAMAASWSSAEAAEPHFSAASGASHGRQSHASDFYLDGGSSEGSDHASDVIREAVGDDSDFSEPTYFSGTTTEISDTADSCSADEISPNVYVKDAQRPRAHQKSSHKEQVVLGRQTLAEVWADMSKTTLPSWIGRAPPRLGDARHGKLSADQWRTACTINLVVTLVRLWGLTPPNDRHHQMLDNFMDLVTACKLAMMRKMTPDRINQFQKHMHRYLETTKKLYVYTALTPNHHLSLHLPQLFENFGPPHAWMCFVFERCLRWLKFIKTSNKFGKFRYSRLLLRHTRLLSS